jgi:hypothetical protein
MKDHTDKSTQLPDKPDVDQYKEIKIFPIMTTDRLILRQFCEADVEAVYC